MSEITNLIRTIGLTTKLPCGRNWYQNGEIDFDLNDEVSIYPMSHSDEMLIHNVDALFSNTAISKIIQSCVPNIKKVNEILSPDVEILLLAIRIASFGDIFKGFDVCPKCLEKYNNEKDETKRQELVDQKIINIEPQQFGFDARRCLDTFEPLKDNYMLSFKDNTIFVHLKPIMLCELSKFDIIDFETKQAIKRFITDNNSNLDITKAEMFSNLDQWKETKEKNEEFNKLLIKLDNLSVDSVISSVKSFIINGKEYTSYEDKKEFLDNIPSNWFEEIRNLSNKINGSHIDKRYACVCNTCGHEWFSDNMPVNPSDFFGSGS